MKRYLLFKVKFAAHFSSNSVAHTQHRTWFLASALALQSRVGRSQCSLSKFLLMGLGLQCLCLSVFLRLRGCRRPSCVPHICQAPCPSALRRRPCRRNPFTALSWIQSNASQLVPRRSPARAARPRRQSTWSRACLSSRSSRRASRRWATPLRHSCHRTHAPTTCRRRAPRTDCQSTRRRSSTTRALRTRCPAQEFRSHKDKALFDPLSSRRTRWALNRVGPIALLRNRFRDSLKSLLISHVTPPRVLSKSTLTWIRRGILPQHPDSRQAKVHVSILSIVQVFFTFIVRLNPVNKVAKIAM